MKIVIALGGNALGDNPNSQILNVNKCVETILPLFKENHQIVLTHGNGPQVGLINLAFEEGKKNNPKVYPMPFPECGAMSQGYIGYHLQNSLQNILHKNGIKKNVVSIITQVEVDKNDKAFQDPTKPIGSFYSYEESLKLPYPTKEDSGRGYRRVIASPKPVKVVEEDVINELIKTSIVITVGGGGIPVINDNGEYKGIDAVIDKDFASSKLASKINADVLLILTQVDNVKINFRKENEQDLNKVSLSLIEKLNDEGHFMKGSMKPKVEAGIEFLKNNKEGLVIITSIDKAFEALKTHNVGTVIYNDYE